jgi:TorA maturation chaperone TorD
MAEAIPIDFRPDVAPEDQARGDLYALLGRLWYVGPDASLLRAIAQAESIAAEGEQVALAESWQQLQTAAGATDPAAAAGEYETLFVGTGKAAITLYVSHYLAESAKERVLVALRDELPTLGLGRAGEAHEPEDHFAALCEVMRHLVAAGSTDAALHRQRKFFTRYIGPAYNRLLEQVFISDSANFYKSVARFTKAFFDIEAAALEML